jgi:hypothetical protein
MSNAADFLLVLRFPEQIISTNSTTFINRHTMVLWIGLIWLFLETMEVIVNAVMHLRVP